MKKVLKLIFWLFLALVGIVLVCFGFITWMIVDVEEERLSKYEGCECQRCTECEDLADSQWIVVEGRSPSDLRGHKAANNAILSAKRQLLWCIEAMPLDTGTCLYNKIKNRPDREGKLKALFEEAATSGIFETHEEETRVILRLLRKKVLGLFNLNETESQLP